LPCRDAALRVADLGTGSGCLLLAFLSERPKAQGMGIDISKDALAFAARNARTLGLENRAQFVAGDWTENLSGAFDVIFVNPPYIGGDLDNLAPEIGGYEPRNALDGGPDGLDAFRRIAAGFAQYLNPQGLAFFEIGQGQAESVRAIFATEGLTTDGTVCDLAGIPRCVVVSKIASKKELALETRSG
jgi:release factor glutamine methyltransferase